MRLVASPVVTNTASSLDMLRGGDDKIGTVGEQVMSTGPGNFFCPPGQTWRPDLLRCMTDEAYAVVSREASRGIGANLGNVILSSFKVPEWITVFVGLALVGIALWAWVNEGKFGFLKTAWNATGRSKIA